MKIVEPSYQILFPSNLQDWRTESKDIEFAARTAYHSEDKISDESYIEFNKDLIKRGHEAAVEFGIMKVKFITDRGVSHALVRHRHCSFLQESTIYCNYTKDKFDNQVSFIKPSAIKNGTMEFDNWEASCLQTEREYCAMIEAGAKPSTARAVLPNCTKTTLIICTNFREWRHIFKLRVLQTTGQDHLDTVALLTPLFKECCEKAPEIFGDLE